MLSELFKRKTSTKRASTKHAFIFLFVCLFSSQHALATQQLPDQIRAIHYTSKNVDIDRMKELVDAAADHQFNVVVIGFAWRESTRLNSMPWVDEDAEWNPERIREIAAYAKNRSVVLVPNIPLLSHQQLLLATHFPELLYNKKTYDPGNDKVYEIVFPIIDELLQLTEAPAFHIGHDEVYGSPNRPRNWAAGHKLLPASGFLESVTRLNDFISSKNVETWMWGDMLVGEQEFPSMSNIALLGDAPGYGAELRNKIPKNVLVVDWHYRHTGRTFPTIDAYTNSGLRVMGATYSTQRNITNFPSYASDRNTAGMMATTWTAIWKMNNEELIENIIRPTGEAYARSFPDSRQATSSSEPTN